MVAGRTLTVMLETVTPVFLGGADARGAPELRPPAFRGALRYWLRAALGGVIGDQDLSALQQREAAVFGRAGEGESSASSAIAIRLGRVSSLAQTTYSQIVGLKRQKSPDRPGLAYLFFAARSTRREPERSALLGQFTLTLQLRPGQLEARLQEAYAALWLLTHLGGIGSRVRRGAGAIQAAKPDISSLSGLPSLYVHANSPEELIGELRQGIHKIRQVLGEPRSNIISSLPAFDVLYPEACKVWVAQKMWRSWKEALDGIGGVLQAFRNRREPDYGVVKSGLTADQPLNQAVQRAGFGLPVPFYYRSLQQGATLRSTNYDRRASPMLIRTVKLANGEYTIVFVWFRSRFLPEGEQLKLVQGDSTLASGPLPAEDGLIQTFLTGSDAVKKNSLKDKKIALLEVNYA